MAQPLYRQYPRQARRLATLDPRRPQQGNLRRAVSTAYYGLFHFLVEQSSHFLVGGVRERKTFRQVLARAYAHGEMAAVARAFGGGTFPTAIVRTIGTLTVPVELRRLAALFVQAQNQRHLADYDLSATFVRDDALTLIDDIELRIGAWDAIRTEPAAEFFLICLLVWDKVRNR